MANLNEEFHKVVEGEITSKADVISLLHAIEDTGRYENSVDPDYFKAMYLRSLLEYTELTKDILLEEREAPGYVSSARESLEAAKMDIAAFMDSARSDEGEAVYPDSENPVYFRTDKVFTEISTVPYYHVSYDLRLGNEIEDIGKKLARIWNHLQASINRQEIEDSKIILSEIQKEADVIKNIIGEVEDKVKKLEQDLNDNLLDIAKGLDSIEIAAEQMKYDVVMEIRCNDEHLVSFTFSVDEFLTLPAERYIGYIHDADDLTTVRMTDYYR